MELRMEEMKKTRYEPIPFPGSNSGGSQAYKANFVLEGNCRPFGRAHAEESSRPSTAESGRSLHLGADTQFRRTRHNREYSGFPVTQPRHNPSQHSAIRRQLEKIAAHGLFARSERMARFLRFAVEGVLEGKSNELKEYSIGVEVFDRPQTYDPRVDPIVRVEARRLRAKLKSYYEADGRNDRV